MTATEEEPPQHHPKAALLVYGFVAVSLASATLASSLLFWLLQSKLVSTAVFLGVTRKFISIAGDRAGINRAVGDGRLSVNPPLLLAPAASNNAAPVVVRICLVSDTHNCHPVLPDADVLVHCGDLQVCH